MKSLDYPGSHRNTGGKRSPRRHTATRSHSLHSDWKLCFLLLVATKTHQTKTVINIINIKFDEGTGDFSETLEPSPILTHIDILLSLEKHTITPCNYSAALIYSISLPLCALTPCSVRKTLRFYTTVFHCLTCKAAGWLQTL